MAIFCAFDINAMQKDGKELKDAKESRDAQASNSSKIYSSDRRFILQHKADGTVSLFKVNTDGTMDKLVILKKTMDEDFPEAETYILSKPVITKTYSVTFSPDDKYITLVNGVTRELTYNDDVLSYENETYAIQLYTVNPLTKKFLLVQEVEDTYTRDQKSAQLTYLPNGKGACLWYPGQSNKLTFFNVNPQTGFFLQPAANSTFQKHEETPHSLVFSPNNRSAAIINYGYSTLNIFSLAPNAHSLPIKSKTETIADEVPFIVSTAYYDPIQHEVFGSCYGLESVAYSADSSLAALAISNMEAPVTSVGSGGIAEAQASAKANGSTGAIYVFNVDPQTGKFQSHCKAISLDFEPVAIAFNPRFKDIIVAGNTKSGGIIRRYGELKNAWKQWAEDTLPEQMITSLTLSPAWDGETMAIITQTTEQGSIEIRDSKTLSPILYKDTNSVIKAPDVVGPVAYNRQGTLAAAVVNGTVAIYIVNQVTGAFTVLTNDLAEYERKSRPLGFSPETEVMSVPNEMGGFRLVPRDIGEKVITETQQRKVVALQHLIAQLEEELSQTNNFEKKIEIFKKWERLAQEHQWANIIKNSDNPALYSKHFAEIVTNIRLAIAQWENELNDLCVEDRIEILKKWAKIAQEKQWAILVKDSSERFHKQLQEARDAFEREAGYASEDINETEIEQELERLAKVAL